jgi:molybdenum cofactor cytidylyltransferase
MNHALRQTPANLEVSAVILAAGSSRRMGQPKMLLPWGKTTVIGQVTGVICAAGIAETVIVTGRMAEEVRAASAAFSEVPPAGATLRCSPAGATLRWVHNPDYAQTEMLQSLQIGLREISNNPTAGRPASAACLIVLGDQPQIECALVEQLLQDFWAEPCPILIPSFQQKRGHPWLVHRALWDGLLALPAEANLRSFLNQHAGEIRYLNVSSPSVLMDLDTPEDYARSRPASEHEAGRS